jgi:probable F420-dependent oxidoreductase
MSAKFKIGLLLPHFGAHLSVEKCLEGARRAEAYGFDSLWARDHLVFKPHAGEGGDNRHLDGLLLLAAVAAATKKINLGTAMAICHRHPIHLAQSFAGLSVISDGRVIMGLGLGGFAHEFAAAGRPHKLEDRAQLAAANIDICRSLWAGEKISCEGRYFDFKDVRLKPVPVKPIPIWIGGGTPAACRRAVRYGDGWMPARITLPTYRKRIEYISELCRAAAKPLITAAVMPFTSVARTKEAALDGIEISSLIDEAHNSSTWVAPPSGSFSTLEDIRGVLLAGAPHDIAHETRAYQEAGAEHVVYDLRLRYADWYEQIDLLGKEVLPALR